jgi:hypothetical protein
MWTTTWRPDDRLAIRAQLGLVSRKNARRSIDPARRKLLQYICLGGGPRVVLGAVFALILTAACSDSKVEGATISVCGTQLSPPGPGMMLGVPFFSDISETDHTSLELPAFPQFESAAAPWIRLASGCNQGAQITISPQNSLVVQQSIKASDGRYVAVRIYGPRVTTATLVGRAASGNESTLEISVLPPSQFGPSAASASSR